MATTSFPGARPMRFDGKKPPAIGFLGPLLPLVGQLVFVLVVGISPWVSVAILAAGVALGPVSYVIARLGNHALLGPTDLSLSIWIFVFPAIRRRIPYDRITRMETKPHEGFLIIWYRNEQDEEDSVPFAVADGTNPEALRDAIDSQRAGGVVSETLRPETLLENTMVRQLPVGNEEIRYSVEPPGWWPWFLPILPTVCLIVLVTKSDFSLIHWLAFTAFMAPVFLLLGAVGYRKSGVTLFADRIVMADMTLSGKSKIFYRDIISVEAREAGWLTIEYRPSRSLLAPEQEPVVGVRVTPHSAAREIAAMIDSRPDRDQSEANTGVQA